MKPTIPAHKIVGDDGKPGQTINTLGDYLNSKYGFDCLKTSTYQATAEGDEWTGKCVLGHCGSPSGCEDSGHCRADPPNVQPKGADVEAEAERRFFAQDFHATLQQAAELLSAPSPHGTQK